MTRAAPGLPFSRVHWFSYHCTLPKPSRQRGELPKDHAEVVLCSRKQMTRSWRIHNRKPKPARALGAALLALFGQRAR